jgi:Peptidase family M1 domain
VRAVGPDPTAIFQVDNVGPRGDNRKQTSENRKKEDNETYPHWAHSSNQGVAPQVTEVMERFRVVAGTVVCVLALNIFSLGEQSRSPSAPAPQPSHLTAESLYSQLSTVGLDPNRVYHAREVSLDRSSIHLDLNDGTIAFTKDVLGHVTGAFFHGDGEVLLMPPNQAERSSMLLFTGAAILEERFTDAYLRFNDDTFQELRSELAPAGDAATFVAQWNDVAQHLAAGDAFRLFLSFSRFLPYDDNAAAPVSIAKDDHLFHARVNGVKLGVFDLYYDSTAFEQIWAGQMNAIGSVAYYDIWTSFSVHPPVSPEELNSINGELGKTDPIHISDYNIQTVITPPRQISSEATLRAKVVTEGERTLVFELSRFLRISRIEVNGKEAEFLHNPSMDGSQLARRGNDAVAVVLPEPLQAGQNLALRFDYEGDVLSQAGGGLLYVGERGTWYPNRGRTYANFDLEFHYPPGWTLVATGRNTPLPNAGATGTSAPGNYQASRWVSERPIPLAGFDLGKYKRVVSHAGDVNVETYATMGVEDAFPRIVEATPVLPSLTGRIPNVEPMPLPSLAPTPSPARNAESVASQAARAMDFYSRCFGPYAYSSLKLAQVPGANSQGWPGLIFLSTYSFLNDAEKAQLHMAALQRTISDLAVSHETAHQWWGDLVGWRSYRDQWMSEALANYSAMLLLRSENPDEFEALMTKYRNDLLSAPQNGEPPMNAGPVTFGSRLQSSRFPDAYPPIIYGRGTWLLQMLHGMLDDGIRQLPSGAVDPANDPFLMALRELREKYAQHAITTQELLQVFAEKLPPSVQYEGQKSLDWFYNGWVNGTSIPLLTIEKVKFAEGRKETRVRGTLVQKDAPDDLVTSVPLYAVEASGKMIWLGRVFADGQQTQFSLAAPLGTRKVVLDPYHTVLRRDQ